MIIDEFIEIKIVGNVQKYWNNLGYDCKYGDILLVNPYDIPKGSFKRFNAKCKICENIINVRVQCYWTQFEKGGYYCCENCSGVKMKETNLKIHGVENPMQSAKIRNKVKNTNLERYGVEYYSQTNEHKIKFEQTSLENWGTKNPNHSDIIKNKIKETNLEKYGVEHPSELEFFKEKAKSTNIQRYGVSNPMFVDEFKEKIKETNLEKYGENYPIQNREIYITKYLKNKRFQSSYEEDFIILCEKNNLDIERGPTIRWFDGEIWKIYYPDFYIKKYNLIIEIKSNYTLSYNLKINLLKKKYTIENGYNYLFIIDKYYLQFTELISILD